MVSFVPVALGASPPSASLSYSPTTPNPDETVTLDASGSTDSDGDIVEYEWDTDGDGYYGDYDDASDGQTARISFDEGGTYTVGVRVSDSEGNTDTERVRITVDNPAPDPSFTFSPSTPNPDDTITLDASGSSDADGSIVKYEWDTDGDGYYDDYDDAPSGQTTQVSFGEGGTYTVGLRVTDNGGKSREITKRITVDNPAPEPSFTFSPSTPNPDDTITLDASDSSDSDGRIVEYEWDTDGDGYYDDYDDAPSGQTTQVSFGEGGTYTVGLRVTDNGGKSREITKRITVDNPAPEPSFTFSPSTPNPDDTITLDASGSSDSDGSIVEYEWDTDGDGYYDDYDDAPSGQTTQVSFGEGGTYTVGLRVTDNGGKSREITKRITVENPPPEPAFTFSPSTPNPDDTITLDASSSSDPDGSIVEYEWDTDGDGNYGDYDDAADGQTTQVSFDEEGTYTVGLRVTDNGDVERTTTRQITVENPAPNASFVVAESDSEGLSVALDAASSSDPDGSIVEYDWYVEGAREATGSSVTLDFPRKGAYEVRLTVTDNGGKTASVTRTVGVSEPPTPRITFEPGQTVGTGQEIRLSGTESSDPDGRVSAYRWAIGGGDTAQGSEITRSFRRPGEYDVTLTVRDETGQERSATRTVVVREPPTASWQFSPDDPIDEETITFTASSEDDIETFRWDFDGDGEFDATGPEVEHAYSDGETKDVTLVAVDQFGVATRVEKQVPVEEVKPSASFEWRPDKPRSGQDVVLTGSTDADDATIEWDFDNDGEFDASGERVTTAFDENGKQVVVMRVTGPNGDTAETSRVVTIQQSASFELTSEQRTITTGDEAVIRFTASNELADVPIRVRLDIDLPGSGAGISGVSGAELASSSATTFVDIEPGGEDSLNLRVQFNSPGEYNLTGTAVYYIGTGENESRRTTTIGPVRVTAVSPDAAVQTGVVSPGFGVGTGLIALLLSLLLLRRD
ncbi:PKD domain-containing protein [Halolamina litorea]|uniref:PKD domain-containing protein n=1 Tax=Halolamina litorea TaxID=1515593 RepID=A0ABD6BNX3_9EURY|nr:PKD domain-containing protein [Halolamina litorea]